MIGRLFGLKLDMISMAEYCFSILLFSFVIWSIIGTIPEGIKVLYLISGGSILVYIIYVRVFLDDDGDDDENNKRHV